MAFQTEYDFILPRGYLDQHGVLYREGTMRLANSADEIFSLRDPRVQQNPEYRIIILLARIVTRLGIVCLSACIILMKIFVQKVGIEF